MFYTNLTKCHTHYFINNIPFILIILFSLLFLLLFNIITFIHILCILFTLTNLILQFHDTCLHIHKQRLRMDINVDLWRFINVLLFIIII